MSIAQQRELKSSAFEIEVADFFEHREKGPSRANGEGLYRECKFWTEINFVKKDFVKEKHNF